MITAASVANTALLHIGGQSQVADTAGAPPFTGPQAETQALNLLYAEKLDATQRAAHWDFARYQAEMRLLKAAPNTPENAGGTMGVPPVPWLYEYAYPSDCLKARFLVPAFSGASNATVPPFMTNLGGPLASPLSGALGIKFQVAYDPFGIGGSQVTAITMVANGMGFTSAPTVTITSATGSGFVGQAVIVNGIVAYVIVINGGQGYLSTDLVVFTGGGGTGAAGVIGAGTGAGDTVGSGTGSGDEIGAGIGSGSGSASATLTVGPAAPAPQRVILTNLAQANLVYTARISDPNFWDPLFLDAFTHVLGAFLVNPLARNRALLQDLVGIARDIVNNARLTDGNEGITDQDHIPDWITVRGTLGHGFYDGGPGVAWLGWDALAIPGGLI